jgi:hypothetical protein
MSFIKTLDDSMKSLVFAKFGTYFGLSNAVQDIVFFPKEVQMRKIAEKRGSDTVEFIGLWRNGIKFDWSRNNSPVARRGLSLTYSDSGKSEILTAKAVPVQIDYDLWFWSRDLDKVMNAVESYLMWQFDNPNLILNYMSTYPLELDLNFGAVIDESPYSQIYESGTYYVSRMPIKLDGWIFSSIMSKTVLEIILKIYLREGMSPNYVDTLVDTFIITSTAGSS